MRRRKELATVAGILLLLAGLMVAQPFGSVAQQDPPATAQAGDDDDNPNVTPVVGTPLFEPEIDLVQAQETALEGQGDAVVVEVDLEGDSGILEYEVELDNGVEVELDATTGEVLRTEQDSDGNDDDGDDGDNDDDDEDESDDD
jgi:hypothetical protein